MAYQVLARKWRPQDFESVVGQRAVVQALRNALSDGRIAHSYLFSGIRGVGKTTVARVLAKALNCQTGPPSDPCNECDICHDITAGSDLDVLEIDAATYSKVEQVRELTDSLQYGPARNAYKVVIIDEIHRLSRQAFDALLKIVEEPPPHLVFIFATTESEAVPATILSRCQSYQFRRVPLVEMVKHLENVSSSEEFEITQHGLHLIARASEGSVRDAIALLDQLATFGGGKILDDEVGRILGGVDLALFLDLIRAIAAGEREQVTGFVSQVEDLGWDPRHVYGEFLSYCRDALHLSLDPHHARVDLPAEEARSLAATAEKTGYENLLRLLNLLLDSEMTVRRSESAGLALEIALLRAAELPKLTAIEEILSGAGGGSGQQTASGASRRAADRSVTTGAQHRATPRAAAPKAPREAVAAAPKESAPASTPAPEEAPRADSPKVTRTEPQPETPATRPQRSVSAPQEMVESSAAEPGLSESAATGPAVTEAPAMEAPATEPPATAQPTMEPAPLESPGLSPEPPPPDDPEAPPRRSPEAAAATDETPPQNGDDTASKPLPPPSIGDGRELVVKLLERLSYLKQPLAAHLSGAQSLAVSDGVLIVSTAPGDSVLEKTLRRSSNRQLLEQTLSEMLGPAAEWKVRAGEPVAASDSDSTETSTPDGVEEDPTVQTVLDLFGGRIETIERHTEPSENQGVSE